METDKSANNTLSRIITATTLGAISILAYNLQKNGYTHQLDQPFKATIESLSHPVLGYAGAWVGIKIAQLTGKNSRQELASSVVFASATNFATEAIQSVKSTKYEAIDFLAVQNLPETGKDYVFALIGAGIFMHQSTKTRQE